MSPVYYGCTKYHMMPDKYCRPKDYYSEETVSGTQCLF